ncbi:ATP-binding protein [sulfur-oxidizing endosymbiont of Gigantopelta aegis]|uniref:ATP-binding protein n=1 Tax=sulfur-oxidizing endosymbiont of Gigantopelta aegis TaxID=2794934 RepID=UPI0018DDCD54|nr:ATP-binding protein [sulfur-oxidizing endosymbiont of Gigantopelta aegis]
MANSLQIHETAVKYTERAQEGCTRLNNLLNRMSEASRLEQSIDAMGKEKIEMVGFIRHYIDAQKATHPDINFQFQTDLKVLYNIISPELIAQLFDKLFSNAISFHKTGTPIILSLHEAKNQQSGENKHTVQIELSNYGAMIDDDKLESIFTSLTSYRNHRSMQDHLGLGLYIASLISQFHQGRLTALNNKREQTMHFIFSLPINK